MNRGPVPDQEMRDKVARLLSDGWSQSAIARSLGLSRQRIHQIAHIDERGRGYRADAQAVWKRADRAHQEPIE